SLHQSIELFVIINLLVVGLSHFIRPQIWVDFFKLLASKGQAGNVFNALLSLGLGSFIFSFHMVWDGPMIIVTIYGLLLTIKGFLYLTVPDLGLKSIAKVDDSYNKFKIVGLLMSSVALYLMWVLISNF
ncbi:MAG: hypothetical protein HKO66_10970, partial [Saprospiraceae bacterium]|nr:hypothetical protein [Bacteroidia bacterium]NNL92747.1 hypothetical protein [Saprospiraceae bacterium]